MDNTNKQRSQEKQSNNPSADQIENDFDKNMFDLNNIPEELELFMSGETNNPVVKAGNQNAYNSANPESNVGNNLDNNPPSTHNNVSDKSQAPNQEQQQSHIIFNPYQSMNQNMNQNLMMQNMNNLHSYNNINPYYANQIMNSGYGINPLANQQMNQFTPPIQNILPRANNFVNYNSRPNNDFKPQPRPNAQTNNIQSEKKNNKPAPQSTTSTTGKLYLNQEIYLKYFKPNQVKFKILCRLCLLRR
ncbi:hypothetical protein K502DRAFT_139449 [Neoconidiobolus thromboides FSU 785]|nr:hypothetical protein K502DRAFT_139449 [Neoconidiobolus thromboides FSU 785]